VTLKFTVFCNVIPCGLVEIYVISEKRLACNYGLGLPLKRLQQFPQFLSFYLNGTQMGPKINILMFWFYLISLFT
jgi:hypothetical protein